VLGFMGGCPIAGVIWQHLHYLLGFARLGCDVTYVEDSATYPYNPVTFETGTDSSYAVETIARLAAQFGFGWAYCARYDEAKPTFGMELAALRRLYRQADAIFNICGSHDLHGDLQESERLFYIETDPGVEQVRIDAGSTETDAYLRRHRGLFTFGEAVPTPEFPVPTHGFDWRSTRQPVVMDMWANDASGRGARFTSIANWSTDGLKDIVWRGETYRWAKAPEFIRFVDAPRVCGQAFELATDIPHRAVEQLFTDNGWKLVLPYELSVDPEEYRRYIVGSKGEFTATKDQYVRLRTGWFSDRSACYLAAGRPVVTEDTGFDRFLPTGKGLFSYRSIEDIRAAVEAIETDYEGNCMAAREIASEYFAAEKVLASLLEQAGV